MSLTCWDAAQTWPRIPVTTLRISHIKKHV
jgi:hypothetical protein